MSELDEALARQTAISSQIDALEDQLEGVLLKRQEVIRARAMIAEVGKDAWAILAPVLAEGGKATVRVGAQILADALQSELEQARR